MKNLLSIALFAILFCIAGQASAEETAKEPSRIMEHCLGNYSNVTSVRSVCYSMQAHTEMTIALIKKSMELYGKKASKDDVISIFKTHIKVVRSLNTAAVGLSTNEKTHQTKQAIFEWHTQVMGEVKGCIEKDQTLMIELFSAHAEAAETLFN